MENKSVYTAVADDIYKIYKNMKKGDGLNTVSNMEIVMNQILNGPKICIGGDPGIVFDKKEDKYIVTYMEGKGIMNYKTFNFTIEEHKRIKNIFNRMRRKNK